MICPSLRSSEKISAVSRVWFLFRLHCDVRLHAKTSVKSTLYFLWHRVLLCTRNFRPWRENLQIILWWYNVLQERHDLTTRDYCFSAWKRAGSVWIVSCGKPHLPTKYLELIPNCLTQMLRSAAPVMTMWTGLIYMSTWSLWEPQLFFVSMQTWHVWKQI